MKSVDSGNRAETAVTDYLKSLGYKILDRNWKDSRSEIDIIASKDGIIYFVEVKYRSSDSAGEGFDYITMDKQRRMHRAAESWLHENEWTGESVLMAASVSWPSLEIDMRELS